VTTWPVYYTDGEDALVLERSISQPAGQTG